MLFSVEQAFVGRNEKRAPLKMPAREAKRIAPCKGIEDSFGFWIPCCGFRIPGTWFQIPILGGIPNSWSPGFQIPQVKISWIPDTTTKNFPDSVLLKSTERRIESIPRKTLQRFTNLGDFSDNSTVGVTSTDNIQKRHRRRVDRSAFLICQIGDNEGRFHLLCKGEIAKLSPIKSEKKNYKNTTYFNG